MGFQGFVRGSGELSQALGVVKAWVLRLQWGVRLGGWGLILFYDGCLRQAVKRVLN